MCIYIHVCMRGRMYVCVKKSRKFFCLMSLMCSWKYVIEKVVIKNHDNRVFGSFCLNFSALFCLFIFQIFGIYERAYSNIFVELTKKRANGILCSHKYRKMIYFVTCNASVCDVAKLFFYDTRFLFIFFEQITEKKRFQKRSK